MYTSCWEQAGVQTSSHPTSPQAAMACRRCWSSTHSQSTGKQGSDARDSSSVSKGSQLTLRSYILFHLYREVSTVCPQDQEAETIQYSALSARDAATAGSGEREGEKSKSQAQHLSCKRPMVCPCSDRVIHTQGGEETIPSLPPITSAGGLFQFPQINTWVLRSSIILDWRHTVTGHICFCNPLDQGRKELFQVPAVPAL